MMKSVSFFFCFFILVFTATGKNKTIQKIDYPLTIQYNGQNNSPLIFHITGDGGAVRFDLKMFKEYKNYGFSFIGLNSLKYFIRKKNPDKAANDMIPVITHYSSLWDKKTLMLVGFSFGAEIIPFICDRLPPEMKQQLKLVVLLTPSKTSDFRIRIRDMIGMDKKNEPFNVADETAKITSTKVLAIYGNEEKPSLMESIRQPNLKVLRIKGGHGFKDSQEVFRLIRKELQ